MMPSASAPAAARGLRWPLLVCALFVAAAVAVLQHVVVIRNGGQFSYAIDDAYIHMAIAKNVVQHHTWGISDHDFSLASSSPLWTGILAVGYSVIGPKDYLPLMLNCVFMLLALCLAHAVLVESGVSGVLLLTALLLFTFVTPLLGLAFAGMEHILHIVLSLAYLRVLLALLAGPRGTIGAGRLGLWTLCSFLLPVARYEGLFFIAIGCVFLILWRAWLPALLTLVASGLSISAVGLYSMAHGGYFLPNSVLLKGKTDLFGASSIAQFAQWAGTAALSSVKSPHVFLLIGGMLLLYATGIRAHGLWSKRQLGLLVVSLVFLLHMAFGAAGSFNRYEAYLVALSLLAIAGALLPGLMSTPARLTWPVVAYGVVGLYLALPLLARGFEGAFRVPDACANVHDQQVKMGAFVKKYYNDAAVALNDVGAVGYMSDARIVDLMGLGSNDVARLRKTKALSTQNIEQLAERAGVALAIVYDKAFTGKRSLPSAWVRVAAWKIPNRFVCWDDTVTFYALQPDEVARLSEALRAYSAELPRGVSVTLFQTPGP